MLCEPDQPFVAHPVEELTDVGIQYPVYVSAYQPCGQCVQCIVLASLPCGLKKKPSSLYALFFGVSLVRKKLPFFFAKFSSYE